MIAIEKTACYSQFLREEGMPHHEGPQGESTEEDGEGNPLEGGEPL